MHIYNTYFGATGMRSSAILDYERETVVLIHHDGQQCVLFGIRVYISYYRTERPPPPPQ